MTTPTPLLRELRERPQLPAAMVAAEARAEEAAPAGALVRAEAAEVAASSMGEVEGVAAPAGEPLVRNL
jgi:hypothetical protein